MWSIGLLSLAVAYMETAPIAGTRASAGTQVVPVTSRAVPFMALQRQEEVTYLVQSAPDQGNSSWLLPLAALALGSAGAKEWIEMMK